MGVVAYHFYFQIIPPIEFIIEQQEDYIGKYSRPSHLNSIKKAKRGNRAVKPILPSKRRTKILFRLHCLVAEYFGGGILSHQISEI